jgi:hypothetical protein
MEYLITTKVCLKNPILDSVNEAMKDFGFDEKMLLVHDQSFVLTVARELNEEEKKKMTEIIEDQFSKSESFHSGKVVSFSKM